MPVFFLWRANLLKHIFLDMMVSSAAFGLQIITHLQDTILVLHKMPLAERMHGFVDYYFFEKSYV